VIVSAVRADRCPHGGDDHGFGHGWAPGKISAILSSGHPGR
jgi:hypothetical protein